MDANARKAFDKLRARGVAVQDAVDYHGDDDEQAHVHFVLQARSYDGSNCFADMSGDWIRESYVNGECINPMGLRHDNFEVISSHGLEWDWYDNSIIDICDSQTLPSDSSPNGELERGRAPSMSASSFSAFKELARLGAPVWDLFSYSRRYQPEKREATAQFVMTCEPKYDIRFADQRETCDPFFEDSEGVAPEVLEVLRRHELSFRNYLHRYPEPQFRPLEMIAVDDPAAGPRLKK